MCGCVFKHGGACRHVCVSSSERSATTSSFSNGLSILLLGAMPAQAAMAARLSTSPPHLEPACRPPVPPAATCQQAPRQLGGCLWRQRHLALIGTQPPRCQLSQLCNALLTARQAYTQTRGPPGQGSRCGHAGFCSCMHQTPMHAHTGCAQAMHMSDRLPTHRLLALCCHRARASLCASPAHALHRHCQVEVPCHQ